MAQISSEMIGQKLKNLRAQKGKTIAEVSCDTGIGVSTLGNYENGIRIPRDETKIELARYYDTTVEDLFYSQA